MDLVWSELAPTREEALAFERRVKPWSRAKKEALIAGDWKQVGHFARPPHERPSTTLGTNEIENCELPNPFVPSEVEGRRTNPGDTR